MEPSTPTADSTPRPASTAPQPFSPPPHLAQAAQASDATTANQPTVDSPNVADDGDLIEKEWVTKVKQIVSHTAHDPYEQNRQFNKLKADYMQKRYGKTIKADE